jgi:hypothetical protein
MIIILIILMIIILLVDIFFDVQEYELYLFSGSTFHYVEPNRSNEERISVSFNIKIF